jgi:hypothetical protein
LACLELLFGGNGQTAGIDHRNEIAQMPGLRHDLPMYAQVLYAEVLHAQVVSGDVPQVWPGLQSLDRKWNFVTHMTTWQRSNSDFLIGLEPVFARTDS